MRKILFIHLFFLGLCPLFSEAQEIKVHGRFLKDSIRIGESVPYVLTARYPRGMDVLFPDSTYDYKGFEYVKRYYSPTKSDSENSFDSVVYYLSTFEIDKVQSLSLPVFAVLKKDSTPIFSKHDSIYLQEIVQTVPDSLALKENIGYRNVDYPFNYPYFLAYSFVALLGIVVVYSVFGNKISRRYKLYIMQKDYNKFVAHFDILIGDLKDRPISEKTEQTLIFWKGYLEKLDSIPYKKLTSKEIVSVTNDESIKPALQNIDKKIYGASVDENIHSYFETLKSFAVERYKIKTEEIKNV